MGTGDKLLKELALKLSPIINRVGSDVLLHDLNFIQQTVIHVRQTKTQLKLFREFQKKQKDNKRKNNFLSSYSKLSPMYNHPACLLEDRSRQKRPESAELHKEPDNWWQALYEQTPDFDNIENGAKVIVLLNILAHAETIGKFNVDSFFLHDQIMLIVCDSFFFYISFVR
jgi:hypothetical protein